ncbi:MAG TPA: hypothetical protein VMC84_07010 [Methanocella sp.]|uniref:hypothetical protein n=1 Tax=Methanocella sp. TaxID=2052833 RepID=UPI002D0F3F70|nr:hypothetical protein [Methanocella sp.]HTY90912.1 hypothetical protein [Methanocella sp.]
MENVSRIITCMGVVLALIVAVVPAGANLTPAWVGIPAIVQSGTTGAFNQNTACATDFENINIKFPAYFDGLHLGASTLGLGVADADSSAGGSSNAHAADENYPYANAYANNPADDSGVDAQVTANVLPFGPVNLAFPDIDQTVFQTQQVTHTNFAQTNELAAFTYPFCVAGPVKLPGFGFEF